MMQALPSKRLGGTRAWLRPENKKKQTSGSFLQQEAGRTYKPIVWALVGPLGKKFRKKKKVAGCQPQALGYGVKITKEALSYPNCVPSERIDLGAM